MDHAPELQARHRSCYLKFKTSKLPTRANQGSASTVSGAMPESALALGFLCTSAGLFLDGPYWRHFPPVKGPVKPRAVLTRCEPCVRRSWKPLHTWPLQLNKAACSCAGGFDYNLMVLNHRSFTWLRFTSSGWSGAMCFSWEYDRSTGTANEPSDSLVSGYCCLVLSHDFAGRVDRATSPGVKKNPVADQFVFSLVEKLSLWIFMRYCQDRLHDKSVC